MYTVSQWLLFFYIYCLVGWLWESCYVSVKKRKWVNRGFMHGPLLPIYGSGAITVLVVTLPVKENLYLVFFTGMLAATILEYVTGAVMERLFHVRYWDYSNQKFQLHGYICLSSSLAWGIFSVLMVRFGHPPVEWLVFQIPDNVRQILVLLITVSAAIDFTQSFNEAMDLKSLLAKLSENEQLKRLQMRIDAAAAFRGGDIQNFRLFKKKFQIHGISDREYLRSARILHRNPGAFSEKYKDTLQTVRSITERIKKAGKK